MTRPENVSALHRWTASSRPDRPAIRRKVGARFQDITWDGYRSDIDAVAATLIQLGVEPGDRIAIAAENRYEWLVADLATLAVGAVNVPLHATLTDEQVAWHLMDCQASAVILSGPDQAAKLAAAGGAAAGLQFVMHFDAIAPVPGIRTIAWADALALQDLPAVLAREQALGADDLASIVYTSGTTAEPKGVMLSHGNILFMLEAFLHTIRPTPGHGVLSWLPLSHIYGRTADHYMALKFGSVLCLAESQQTLVEDLAATEPRWFFAVPQFFDRLWAKIGALPEAHRQPALRGIVGANMERMTSGGAPLAPSVAHGFAAAGYPIYEGYGMTEATGVITMQPFAQCRPGTVGTALWGTEVRIAEDGEVLVRGPHVMQGYWNDAAATDAVLREGWLHTGDLGSLDADGFLSVTGREKDVFVTSGGKNVNPAVIESLLAQDPCIALALAIGDGRPYLTALVVPDPDVVRALAGLPDHVLVPDDDGFLADPSITGWFQARIDQLMQGCSPHEQVRRVLVLGRALRPDQGEVTATAKLRRANLLAGFQARIDALYG